MDASKRPLKIPVKFIPYLEKHDIFNLFRGLATSIIIEKPNDILQFMKNEVIQYEKRAYRPRQIMFIAPPHLAIQHLADQLYLSCKLTSINYADVVREVGSQEILKNVCSSPIKLANATLNYIKVNKLELNNGWIMVGFPNTKEEGIALQKVGIFPTHTFQITHDPKEYDEKDFWNDNLSEDWSYEGFSRMMKDYKRRAVGLRQIYQSTLKTIVVRGRTLAELKNDILSSLLKFNYDGLAFAPRVALLGVRGSRRRTLAKMMSERLKLVHIHFWDLMEQAKQWNNDVGDAIRDSLDLFQGINMNAALEILEKRLLSDDCLERGWVLTGFPNDECDFKNLDTLSTPPNKIIFLEIPSEVCYKRLKDRCINMYTGEVLSKAKIADNPVIQNQTTTHPHDAENIITQEQKAYLTEYHVRIRLLDPLVKMLKGALII
ncbi:adenylate kinase 8-like isoform X1 [Nilaparvata lugens]|uniref:adenylate kinase 8-like isoform X1 n=1 Tax=Nilaparvata lugens TaxID=108931 RepID=UPI00193D0647|nr:adenylate kinase 8-like isoform X1 [Nilaparvata lugens]